MHKLKITKSERFILLIALRRYISWCSKLKTKEGYVPYAKVAFKKLLDNLNPEVDGGEMITFVEALRYRSTMFYQNDRLRDSEYLHELANNIDLQRQYYQYTNGPKIEKSS
ncbi:hypothetical protein M3936_14095 [Sutcliffiella horikoshii]|uniref:hypothetical protein n=1 Tax=Sutcliffiella horikoshii TaxID=79883 RepID=UPI00203EAA49|nr:hypothetical protein [Sutcliffiella horikoshii]MCM3618718.1 hypothetical protein [Sutcliffiella horikoshii]